MLGTPRGLLFFSAFYNFLKKGRFWPLFLPILIGKSGNRVFFRDSPRYKPGRLRLDVFPLVFDKIPARFWFFWRIHFSLLLFSTFPPIFIKMDDSPPQNVNSSPRFMVRNVPEWPRSKSGPPPLTYIYIYIYIFIKRGGRGEEKSKKVTLWPGSQFHQPAPNALPPFCPFLLYISSLFLRLKI